MAFSRSSIASAAPRSVERSYKEEIRENSYHPTSDKGCVRTYLLCRNLTVKSCYIEDDTCLQVIRT